MAWILNSGYISVFYCGIKNACMKTAVFCPPKKSYTLYLRYGFFFHKHHIFQYYFKILGETVTILTHLVFLNILCVHPLNGANPLCFFHSDA